MFKNLNAAALGISGHQSEIIELALTYGFAGMDLNIAEFATRVRLKGLPYARRLIDSAKIRIGTFALPMAVDVDDETFQKELKKLPEYGEAAAALGCTRATATLAPAAERPYHENFEFHRHRLQEICGALRPSGVRLALGFQAAEYLRRNQPFQFIHEPDALLLLLNMVAAPNVGLLLDLWDWTASGAALENIRKLPPGQIVAVQVAEMPAAVPLAELDEKARLLPSVDARRTDVPALLGLLHELSYDGPVTAKPSRTIFQSRRRDVVIKQTGEALDKSWQAAGLPLPPRLIVASARD